MYRRYTGYRGSPRDIPKYRTPLLASAGILGIPKQQGADACGCARMRADACGDLDRRGFEQCKVSICLLEFHHILCFRSSNSPSANWLTRKTTSRVGLLRQLQRLIHLALGRNQFLQVVGRDAVRHSERVRQRAQLAEVPAPPSSLSTARRPCGRRCWRRRGRAQRRLAASPPPYAPPSSRAWLGCQCWRRWQGPCFRMPHHTHCYYRTESH